MNGYLLPVYSEASLTQLTTRTKLCQKLNGNPIAKLRHILNTLFCTGYQSMLFGQISQWKALPEKAPHSALACLWMDRMHALIPLFAAAVMVKDKVNLLLSYLSQYSMPLLVPAICMTTIIHEPDLCPGLGFQKG